MNDNEARIVVRFDEDEEVWVARALVGSVVVAEGSDDNDWGAVSYLFDELRRMVTKRQGYVNRGEPMPMMLNWAGDLVEREDELWAALRAQHGDAALVELPADTTSAITVAERWWWMMVVSALLVGLLGSLLLIGILAGRG